MATRIRFTRIREMLHKSDIPEGVLSEKAFRIALDRECSRADRGGHQFALLLCDFRSHSGPANPSLSMVTAIARRVRTSDQIGMFESRRIGIILPETDIEGAGKLAEDLLTPLKSGIIDISYDIHVYPLLPNRSGDSGSKDQKTDFPFQRTSPPEMLSPPFAFPLRFKRVLDVFGSLLALIVLSPVMLLTAIVIFIVSPGPVIFRQQRLGFLRRQFTMYKFRTMRADCEQAFHQEYIKAVIKDGSPLTKLDAQKDPRLIPAGKLLRRCFVDELPQLFNVLLGDMSLVGPRPCLPFEAAGFAPWQNRRFNVLPGITGLWQTHDKENTTFLQMLRYDVAYAHGSTLWLDLRILLSTFPVIMKCACILNVLHLRSGAGLNTAPALSHPQRRAQVWMRNPLIFIDKKRS